MKRDFVCQEDSTVKYSVSLIETFEFFEIWSGLYFSADFSSLSYWPPSTTMNTSVAASAMFSLLVSIGGEAYGKDYRKKNQVGLGLFY